MNSKPLILGIGNRYRGDDALGCLIADDIKNHVPDNVEVMEHDGEPASLIDLWKDRDLVILVDAVSSGTEAGTIHHIDLNSRALPDSFRSYSTHAFGIAEAVELSKVLNKMPKQLIFYGIEGKSFAATTELSEPIKIATKELNEKIMTEIEKENSDA